MAYTCQNFQKGQKLTAECMNRIDEWLEYICGKEIQSGAIDIDGNFIVTCCDGTKVNLGPIGNGGVAVDSSMSDASTNPVQNKVIKAYIDDAVGGIGTWLAAL